MSILIHQPRQQLKKWTQKEYLDLVELGAFEGQRIYLFRGDIIEMPPHGHEHAFGIMKLSRYLMDTFPAPFEVRIQCSFITSGQSVPEPDAAVCSAQDSLNKPHPRHADLVVEVAASSLDYDRAKAEEYAAALVPEYWIIDTDRRCVEVYRNPVEDATARLGYRYADLAIRQSDDEIAPLTRPNSRVAVSTFYP
jgi:Uma2 family endonuclease